MQGFQTLFLAGLNTQMALCVEAVNFGGYLGGDRRYQREANCSVRSHRAVDHLIPASLREIWEFSLTK